MFGQFSPSSDEEIMADQQYRSAGPCRSYRQNKGHLWLESEHDQFIAGLAKLGRGNWRDISRWFVPSRTPTQVASHAQKYFMRISGVTKKRSRFSSLVEPKKYTVLISSSSQQDSQQQRSESNSPASTTVTTTSSDATATTTPGAAAAAAAAAAALVTPNCPTMAPCSAAPAAAAATATAVAHAATATAAAPLPAGRELGVPVFLPGPGGLPMVLTYPQGCCSPMVTPFSPWTFSTHMVAGPASKKASGTAADLGIWPSPMMLHAMTSMQQQQLTMAAAVEAAAVKAAALPPASPVKRPRPPPYTLPAGVCKPSVAAAAKGCSAALLQSVLASVVARSPVASSSQAVATSFGSAFRPVAAAVAVRC